MNGNKRVILHITFDNILFDMVYPDFEKMEDYENRYLLGSLKCNQEIKYIKNTQKLIRFESLEEWGKIVSDPQVDIIYFHGLWEYYLKAIDFIGQDVIVMWWCYGMEIYENCFGYPPLLNLRLYKPRTFHFLQSQGTKRSRINRHLLYYHPGLYVFMRRFYNIISRKSKDKLKAMLSRIDFASTPLESELVELKKRHSFIKAKPFRLWGAFIKEPIETHEKTGYILLEHSASVSNNHLDIIASIKDKRLDLHGRDIYIPLSYGIDTLAKRVKGEATFEGAHTHCLSETLPLSEYKELISGCTHAIFGMIRQSGLGNIYLCFKKGIKMFFFKDSILYKQFILDGYHVFSIEDDLNDNSIREPLSKKQALSNYNLFYSHRGFQSDSYQQQFDKLLKNSYG